MAVRHGYGKIAGTDALVFAYDTGDTRNSFKGKPTTNFIAELGDPTEERARGEFGQYFNLVPIFETHGLVPYTLSMEIKGNIPGTCLVYMQNGSYTKYSFVGTWVDITTEWQRFVFPNLTPSGPTAAWQANTPNDHRAMLATYTIYGSGRNPTVRNVQLEHGAYATPFTTNTRSATQGLLDLTGNNTISLNSSTFDSNAQIDLDGTNTSIYPGTISAASGLSEVTFETVVRSNANNKNILLTAGNAILLHYGGAGFYLVSSDGTASGYLGWNSEIAGGTGVYEHLAATWDGSTMKLYVNGQKITYDRSFSGGTSGVLKPFNNTTLGGYFNSTQPNFNGNIDVAKIYNRALTADEVRNNYRHYKTRFDI